jgi:hypothetical protein
MDSDQYWNTGLDMHRLLFWWSGSVAAPALTTRLRDQQLQCQPSRSAQSTGDMVWYLRGKHGDQVVGYDRGLNLNVAWLTVGYVRALAPFASSSRCREAKPQRWPKFERDLDNRGHSGHRSKPVQGLMPCQECFNVGDHCECGDLLSNKSMT